MTVQGNELNINSHRENSIKMLRVSWGVMQVSTQLQESHLTKPHCEKLKSHKKENADFANILSDTQRKRWCRNWDKYRFRDFKLQGHFNEENVLLLIVFYKI